MNPLEYDEESDCAYVRITSKPPYLTVELSERIGVDVSLSGAVVGVEILDASTVISDLFGKKISREDVEKILCKVSEKDAIYLNFELENTKASLAIPKAYHSPALTLPG